MTIRRKLFLPLILILLELGIAGYYSIKVSEKTLIDAIGQQTTILADQVLNKMDQIIYFRIQEAKILAKDSVIQDAVKESNAEFEKLGDVQAYIDQKDKDWISFSKKELSPFMQEIIDSAVSHKLKEMSRRYKDTYGYNLIGEIFITNKFGANVAQSGRTSDYRQGDESWWQTAKKDGMYVSEINYDESAGVEAINICVRIEGKNGEFLGVMKVVMNVEQTIDILKDFELKKHSYNHEDENVREFKLVDKKFQYIYSTEAHEPGTLLDKKFIQKISQERNVSYWVDKENLAKEGGRLVIYHVSDGFKDYKGLGWILIMEYKTEEILASINKLRTNIIIFLLITVLFVILVSRQIYKWFVLPLIQLQETVVKVGQGHWDTPIEVKSNDEIGHLATAFKDMTKKLKESSENLEEKIKQRTSELQQAQTQVIQSEKLASIGQLAAGVAHEINNPVGFISNNMEILAQYISEYTKIFKMVENIKKSIEAGDIEKAKSIIREMTQFEKEIQLDDVMNDVGNLLEHNQKGVERIRKIVLDLRTFAREEVDVMDQAKIEEVIDSILSIVHNEIKYKAELKKNYGQTPLIKCNSQRLGQVFMNLLINAVHAIEEKGTIEIKTYVQGQYVCVDVSDSGKGIEEKNLKKIFDPFFTTKPAGQGTGLGLSISYEIVKKHGGEIKVHSKVGEGTTFTVMLPVT